MSLYEKTITGLYNGISQQSPSMRLLDQCSAQENMVSSVIRGLEKRPPVQFVSIASSLGIDTDSLFYAYERDDEEGYQLFFTGNGDSPIRVLDAEGTEVPVIYDNAQSAINQYLTTEGSAREKLQISTIADTTIISNSEVTVEALDVPDTSSRAQPAYVWIKRGVSYTTYTIEVNGQSFSYTSDTSDDSQTIAAELQTASSTVTGHTITVIEGSLLKIVNSTDPTIKPAVNVSDGYGNQASVLIQEQIEKRDDLPPAFEDGGQIQIQNDEGTGFWVQYDGENREWAECPSPYVSQGLVTSTMPVKVYRAWNGNDPEFHLSQIEWDVRLVGDEDSSPTPDFVGETIKGFTFFKNRLGIVSDTHVVYSAIGDYYRFYHTTAEETLADDPISLTLGDDRHVVELYGAVSAPDGTFLTSSTGCHLVYGTEEGFTAQTAQVTKITSDRGYRAVQPQLSGSIVFFPAPLGSTPLLREYYGRQSTLLTTAPSVMDHVPKLFPQGSTVRDLIAISNTDSVIVTTDEDSKAFFLYQYYWSGQEKVQSSWSRHTFDLEVIGMSPTRSGVYIYSQHPDYAEQTIIGFFAMDHDKPVFLDHFLEYDNEDALIFPSGYNQTDDLEVAIMDADGEWLYGIPYTANGNEFTLEAPYDDAQKIYIGRPYTSSYEFTEFYHRHASTGVGITTGNMTLTKLCLELMESGGYTVEVADRYRDPIYHDDPYSRYLTNAQIGGFQLGARKATDREDVLPVRGNARGLTVTLMSTSAQPLRVVSATYAYKYINRIQQR